MINNKSSMKSKYTFPLHPVRVLGAACLLAVIAPGASSQNISLDSCRSMAIRNNKTIRIADQGIEGAAHLRKAARAAYLPGLDFNMTYMYNQRTVNLLGEDAKLPTMTFNPATGKYEYNVLIDPATHQPVVDPKTGMPVPTEVAVIPKEAMSYDTHNVFAGAVTLTQPVYMGGEIRAMNELTRYAEDLAVSQRNAAVQNLVYSVDEAYWQVVSLRAKQTLANNYVLLMDSLLYDVQAMKQEGVATQSDVLTVEVKHNEAQIMQTKVNNGLSLSRMALAQLCGLPIDAPLEPTDDPARVAAQAQLPASLDINEVYARRQDLAMIRSGINIFEQKERVAMASMLPKVAIVGAYAFSNPNVNNGFAKSFGGGFSVGATLTVPIWHWGGNYYRYRAAKAETNVQRLMLAEAEEMVSLQVNQARYRYQEAYKTYAMTVKNMEKANENLRQAQYAYREGVMTLDDVIAAQTAWLQAHSEKIDAEIGVQLCNTYLSKVLGLIPY